jgi:hypothetical protein
VIVITGMDRIVSSVFRMSLVLLIWGAAAGAALPLQAAPPEASGRIVKVLPHLLDEDGNHTVSPSLFDRDAYQALLRANPERVTGIRYDVRWKASRANGQALTVRLELRGLFEGKFPRSTTLETTVQGQKSLRCWTALELSGDPYLQFGKVIAWRATLWNGETLMDEYRSFLW